MGDDLKGRWRAVFPARENEATSKRFRMPPCAGGLRRLFEGHPMESSCTEHLPGAPARGEVISQGQGVPCR